MVDYNDCLPVEEKIKFMQVVIEKEKEKFAKFINENEDPIVHLNMLEEYYLSLKDMNERYYSEKEEPEL